LRKKNPKKSRQGIEKMYAQKSHVLLPLGRGVAKYPDKSFLKGLYKEGRIPQKKVSF
jgi:hypothetical protein